VAEAITAGTRIKDGAAYLEKIVQLTVMVPKPEPFSLRNWFQEDLQSIFGAVPDEVRGRLSTVIDQEGGHQLRTPRSVIRSLDSIRFLWPALRDEKIDAADLVWVQLIKDGSPKFYRWVEDYTASVATASFGTANVPDNGKAERLKALIEVISSDQLGDVSYLYMLEELLPGVRAGRQAPLDRLDHPVQIYQSINKEERGRALAGHRLASPDHYRFYFSLIGPTHAIAQSAYGNFWKDLETGPAATAKVLSDFQREEAHGSARKLDVLLDRLREIAVVHWTGSRAHNLLLGLGHMMDEAYGGNPRNENFIVDSWDRAGRMVPILYGRVDQNEREDLSRQFFSESKALGWLTFILRRETFSHGKYGDRQKRPEEWWISETEFVQACQIMIDRYRSISLATLIKTPRPIEILCAWSQAGDTEGPGKFLQESMKTDEDFFDILNIFIKSVYIENRGRSDVISRVDFENFLNHGTVMERLLSIQNSNIEYNRIRAKEWVARLTVKQD
jgi:hypothetical protein